MKKLAWVIGVVILAGCAASTGNVGSLVLPTSGRTIDVVQHRSDNKECVTAVVLQTYDATGRLIDSKSAQGNASWCQVLDAGIQAGGIVGAASVLRPSKTNVNNSNEQSQGQGQVQVQGQKQSSSNTNTNTNVNGNTNSNTATGGAGGAGGAGGQGGQGGNNGIGNGSGDGTNPGTGHSHSGDNS